MDRLIGLIVIGLVMWGASKAFAPPAIGPAVYSPAPPSSFVPVNIYAKLEDIGKLDTERQAAPASQVFGPDKQSLGRQIDAQMVEVTNLLLGSRALQLRQEVVRRRASIVEIDRKIGEAEMRLTGDGRREVDQFKEERRKLEGEIAGHTAAFQLEMRQAGLPDSAADGLLATVTGDDMVQLAGLVEHIKVLEAKLAETMATATSIEGMRRYYGTHLLLLRMVDRFQRHVIAKIDTNYAVKLGELSKDAEQLKVKAASLLAQSKDNAEKAVLKANLNAQDAALRAAAIYQDYLRQQRGTLDAANQRLNRKIAVAENAAATVRIVSELAALIVSGRTDIQAVLRLELPVLAPFPNDAVQKEFERLTAAIAPPTS